MSLDLFLYQESCRLHIISSLPMPFQFFTGPEKLTLRPVKNCRGIGKEDMMWNDKTPDIEINPETYEVKLDGKICYSLILQRNYLQPKGIS